MIKLLDYSRIGIYIFFLGIGKRGCIFVWRVLRPTESSNSRALSHTIVRPCTCYSSLGRNRKVTYPLGSNLGGVGILCDSFKNCQQSLYLTVRETRSLSAQSYLELFGPSSNSDSFAKIGAMQCGIRRRRARRRGILRHEGKGPELLHCPVQCIDQKWINSSHTLPLYRPSLKRNDGISLVFVGLAFWSSGRASTTESMRTTYQMRRF